MLENIFSLFFLNEEISFLSSDNSNQKSKIEVLLDQKNIGFLEQQFIKEKNKKVFFAQISLTQIFNFLANSSPSVSYQPISNFPTSEKDLSLIFSASTDHNQVIKGIKKIGGEDLREVEIFDVYQNPQLIKEGKKSISFHLIFQSAKRTLKKTEIENNMTIIINKLKEMFQTEERS